MNNRKYFLSLPLLIITAVLAVFSISFISCPPLEEEPFDNTMKISDILTQSRWNDILDEIYTAAIPVVLDLSECTAPGSGGDILKLSFEDVTDYDPDSLKAKENIYNKYIQFNPSMGSRFGKDLITSLIIPDVATMINNASDNLDIETLTDASDDETHRFAFRHFTNLKSVTGRNIRLIGTFAFYDCKSLTEANFPNVLHLMQYAFYNCSSVKRFSFEKLVDIMPSAFESCSALERAEFHNAKGISQRAFINCTGLTDVSFSNAVKIEPEAFRNCSSLKVARFLASPMRKGGHPLDNWRTGVQKIPYSDDTLAFQSNVFRGCTSLETLDVRNAWNVFFGAGALADIGASLTIYMYDDDGAVCCGHPQVELLLGGVHPDLNIGNRTLKEIKIISPVVVPATKSQIMYADDKTKDGYSSIRNRINAVYNPGDRYVDYNEPKNPVVKVTVNGIPAASHFQ